MWKRIKGVLHVLDDILCTYIPSISFVVLFIVFTLQILFRYIIKSPLTWTYEASSIAYLWVITLGAASAQRKDEHVRFTMIYDALPPRWKAVFDLLGNGLAIFCLGVSIIPTIQYTASTAYSKTSLLRVPYASVFAPFTVMLVLCLIYFCKDFVNGIRRLIHPSSETADDPWLSDSDGQARKESK